jgi:hypothetical protein
LSAEKMFRNYKLSFLKDSTQFYENFIPVNSIPPPPCSVHGDTNAAIHML